MFRGFNVFLTSEFDGYKSGGRRQIRRNSQGIEDKIASFLDSNGNIIAENIIKEWFPKDKFDIFISHTHRDIEKVSSLVGYIEDRLEHVH